jgi:acyl CoA:acetate/3-ketoacid CoA transferase beta subunit
LEQPLVGAVGRVTVAAIQAALGARDLFETIQTGAPVVSSFLGTFSVDAFGAIVLTIIGFIGCVNGGGREHHPRKPLQFRERACSS